MIDSDIMRQILALQRDVGRLQLQETPRNAILLASVASISLNVSTKTALYTVPAGKSCVVTAVCVRAASAGLSATFGFGFDASCTDVIAQATHTELTGATLYTVLTAKAGAKLGAAADVFGVKVSAGTQVATVTIDVYGRVF